MEGEMVGEVEGKKVHYREGLKKNDENFLVIHI